METGKALTANDNRLVIEEKSILCVEIYLNDGQIPGLPTNPRFIKDERFEKLCKSLSDSPEYLNVRKIVVIEYAGAFVCICGNMRLRAAMFLGFVDIPCIILNPKTPIEKLKEYLIKDNVSFGSDDFDLLANDFDSADLLDWGLEIPNFDEFVPDDDEGGTEATKDTKIEIVFHGNLDQYDDLKLKVEKLIEPFEGIVIK